MGDKSQNNQLAGETSMIFKVAAGSTVGHDKEEVGGLKLVVEVTCPKCGVNVEPGCLVLLKSQQDVWEGPHGHEVSGHGLVTPCCHMVVAMDQDFSRWIDYQSASHERHPEITFPFNGQGIVCDISDGVKVVGPHPTEVLVGAAASGPASTRDLKLRE
jgi:hypothetical protein